MFFKALTHSCDTEYQYLLSGRRISTVRISCQVFLYRWWNESKQQYLLVSVFVLQHYTFSRKVSCSNLNTNQHLLPVCGSSVLRGFEQLMDLQETVWFCRCRGRFGPEPRCSEGVKSQEAKKTKKNFPFQMKPSASQPLPSFPFLSFLPFLPSSVRPSPSSAAAGWWQRAGSRWVRSGADEQICGAGYMSEPSPLLPRLKTQAAAAAAAAAVCLSVPFKLKQTETRRRSALP